MTEQEVSLEQHSSIMELTFSKTLVSVGGLRPFLDVRFLFASTAPTLTATRTLLPLCAAMRAAFSTRFALASAA